MAFSADIETFIKDYLKEIQDQNAAIFAGAGLSKGSGAVDWIGLLQEFAAELKLDAERESDLVTLTQYYLNHHGQNRSSINKKLLQEFHHGLTPNENHRILARLPIGTYWTTNYDKLIEMAMAEAGKVVDAKHSVQQLTVTVPGRDVTVYKMHGDVDMPHETIISKDEYERYHTTHGPFLNALAGDLTGKTFLFYWIQFYRSQSGLCPEPHPYCIQVWPAASLLYIPGGEEEEGGYGRVIRIPAGQTGTRHKRLATL